MYFTLVFFLHRLCLPLYRFSSWAVIKVVPRLRSVVSRNAIGSTHDSVFHLLEFFPKGILFLNGCFSHNRYLSIIKLC